MEISKAEFNVLKEIVNGNKNVKEIAKALKKSRVQIYRISKKLIHKDILSLLNGTLQPRASVHVNLLMQLLEKYPGSIKPLSDSGIKILTTLIEPKTAENVLKETGFKISTIFKKLKEAKAISLIRPINGKYVLNDKLWSLAIDFLNELKLYETQIDSRVPPNATIYYKNQKEIIFSSRDELNAALTAFSIYEKYDIKVLTITNYYYLPKKELTKKQIFQHSLYIAEKDKFYMNIILITLFYVKFKNELSDIRYPILDNINKILKGEKVKEYPSLAEIKDRADVYDIKI